MLPGQRLRYPPWSQFDCVFAHGETDPRYRREIICGPRRAIRSYHLTTDVAAPPPESPWLIRTPLPGPIKKTVGHTYGRRTWIAYGLKQSKNELGWADGRLTAQQAIEKWGESVCSAALMVSLQAPVFPESLSSLKSIAQTASQVEEQERQTAQKQCAHHTWWDQGQGWKNRLNHLRLLMQPAVFYWLLSPWLSVFAFPALQQGFRSLIAVMNNFQGFVPV
jgi:hypothetical protein